ncbi:MAG: hypothetical protein H0X34_05090 [Chthoniobacterales bacterium]|nr:hypothetical protein [Chthoniobacterales bacterium]
MPDEELLPISSDFDTDGALSRDFLLRRGNCCKNGCRNCPYGCVDRTTGLIDAAAAAP